jgi:hypothetical protein
MSTDMLQPDIIAEMFGIAVEKKLKNPIFIHSRPSAEDSLIFQGVEFVEEREGASELVINEPTYTGRRVTVH